MKRKYCLISLLLLLSLGSCKKFLDKPQPEDTLSPGTYYQTAEQLNMALAAVYDILQTAEVYKTYSHYLRGWQGDEGFNRSAGLTTFTISFNHTPATASVSNYWIALYKGIARANSLIENVDNNESISPALRNQIRGEALFLRGYYYFLLAQTYGGVPLIIESYSNINNTDMPRAPLADVYAQIVADMTSAEALVPKITILGFGGRVNKSAVRGILARVCLYMAGEPLKDISKYADAKKWAEMVINDAEAAHTLNPSYSDVFIKIAQDKYDIKESIWEVEFFGNGGGTYGGEHSTVGYNIGASSPAVVGASAAYIYATGILYNSYEFGDVRKGWNIQNVDYNATTGVKTFKPLPSSAAKWTQYAAKWRREYELFSPKGASHTPQNFHLLRYSDVLLMYAEAENAINGPTLDAQTKVNQVRRRAFAIDGIKSFVVTNSGSGYITAPTVTITGGGGTGATATAIISSGRVTTINLDRDFETEFKYGKYTSAPTVTISAPPTPSTWTAATAYAVTTTVPVRHLNNLYRVTTAGTSTVTPPTHTSGASTAASTGAVFTFMGTVNTLPSATATATLFTNADADVPSTSTVSKEQFLTFLQAERSRELCFESMRKFDLVRWGIYASSIRNAANLAVIQGVSPSYHMVTWFSQVEDKHALYPIPDSELTLNKLLVQNPGW